MDLNTLYELTEKVQAKGSGLHLNMKEEDFIKAVLIIATSNSAQAQYIVPVDNNYSCTHDILIKSCNANLVNKLIAAGYSLSMCEKGLIVNKY